MSDLVHIPDELPALYLGRLDTVGPDVYEEGRHALAGRRVIGQYGQLVESWLTPGEDYRLTRDTTGWYVEPWAGPGPQRYLTDRLGQMVDRVPLDEDHPRVSLLPSQTYRIRHLVEATEHDGAADRWGLEIA